MTPYLKFVIPRENQKVFYVCKDTHEAVPYFAKDKKVRLIEATDYLLRKALKEEYSLEEKTDEGEE
jgi:hypothetical protein